MTKLAEITKKLFSLIMSKITKILQKRSSVENQPPRPEQLEFGEIAINFNVNNPFLSIKNSSGDVVEFHTTDQTLKSGSTNPVSNAAVSSGLTESMKPLFIELTSTEGEGDARGYQFVGYTPRDVIELLAKRNVIIYYNNRTFTLFEIDLRNVAKFISPNDDKTNMVLTVPQSGNISLTMNSDTNVTYIDVTSGTFTGFTGAATYSELESLVATDTVVVFYDTTEQDNPVYAYLTKVVDGENGYMDFMAVLPDEIYELKALKNGTVVKTSYPVSEGLPASAMTLNGYETPENAEGSDIINSGLTITEAFSSVVSAVTDNTNAIDGLEPVIGEMVYDNREGYIISGSPTLYEVVNAAKAGKLAAIQYDGYTYKLTHNWMSGNAEFSDFVCVKDTNTVSVIEIDSKERPYAIKSVDDYSNVMMFFVNRNQKITSITFEELVALAMEKNRVLGIYNDDDESGYNARDRYTYFSFDCVANGGDLPNGYVKFTHISGDRYIVATCTDGNDVIDVSYTTYNINTSVGLEGYVSPANTLGDDILDSGMTVSEAFESVISAITDNELTVSASINELNDRVDVISGAVENIEVPSMADYESPANTLGDDVISSGMTITQAFEAVVSAMTDNELVTSNALNTLRDALDALEQRVALLET